MNENDSAFPITSSSSSFDRDAPGRPKDLEGTACVYIVAGLVLIWEVLLLGLLYLGDLTWMTALAGHHLCLAGLGVWVFRARKDPWTNRFAWLLWVTTSTLGPIGALGSATSLNLWRVYRRSSIPFEEWYASIFPTEVTETTEAMKTHFAAVQEERGEPGVVPFKDILLYGSLEQKMEVLVRIAKQFRPGFGPALKMALNDSNNAIRVQAATAIAKIDNDFSQRVQRFKAELEHNPQKAEALRGLAELYDNHAHSELLDEEREEESRQRALQYYTTYLNQLPGDREARMTIGRILLRSQRHQEAAAWLEQTLEMGICTPQILLWYMECLSRLGQYTKLRQLAQAHFHEWDATEEFPPEAVQAVRLWLGQGADPTALRAEGVSG